MYTKIRWGCFFPKILIDVKEIDRGKIFSSFHNPRTRVIKKKSWLEDGGYTHKKSTVLLSTAQINLWILLPKGYGDSHLARLLYKRIRLIH